MNIKTYKPCALMVGRFQPITNGHIKCINYAYKTYGLPTVLLIIETHEDKADIKKPFPTALTMSCLREIFPYMENVLDCSYVKNANIIDNSEHLFEIGYKPFIWICGEDRFESYNKMVERYKDRLYCSNDFKVIQIPRTANDISATKVRDAILNDEYEYFCNNTPYGKLPVYKSVQIFNQLKKQLITVTNSHE